MINRDLSRYFTWVEEAIQEYGKQKPNYDIAKGKIAAACATAALRHNELIEEGLKIKAEQLLLAKERMPKQIA